MRLGRFLALGIVAEKLSTADAAEQIGIKTKTLAAIIRGGRCDGPTLVKILAWLTEPEGVPTPEAKVEQDVLMPRVQLTTPRREKVSRGVVTT